MDRMRCLGRWLAAIGMIGLGVAVARGEASNDASRPANGEAYYEGRWVPISALFKEYRAVGADVQALADKIKDAHTRGGDLQKQLNTLKAQSAKAEQPVRADLAKAKARRAVLQKAVAAKPPTPPSLEAMILRGKQVNPSQGGVVGGGREKDAWVQETERLRQEYNEQYIRYQQVLAQYQRDQAAAKTELPALAVAIQNAEAKLAQSAADLAAQQAPILEKLKPVNEETRGYEDQKRLLVARMKGMADALRTVPENVRFRQDIIEWEDAFYTRSDLEKIQADLETRIAEDRIQHERLSEPPKFDPEHPMAPPPAWRHPQQDRMEALKALLDRIRPARGDKPAA